MKRGQHSYSSEDLAGMEVSEALRLSCLPRLGRATVKAEVVADRMNLPMGTFNNLMSGAKGRELLARELPAVVHATQDDLVIQVVAAKCGGSFHRECVVEGGARPRSATEAIQREILEHADVERAVIEALEDGDVSEVELRRFDKEVGEHLAALGRLRESLQGKMKPGLSSVLSPKKGT